jgi:hypothetical protein
MYVRNQQDWKLNQGSSHIHLMVISQAATMLMRRIDGESTTPLEKAVV